MAPLAVGNFWWVPSVVSVLYAVYHMHGQAEDGASRRARVFSARELATFDGRGGEGLIYLSIMGRVFDVTRGAEFYAPGAGYECFAGRDASLAFVTGEFEGDRTDDVSPLRGKQLAELAEWVNSTYHAKYDYLGVLGGGYFFDASGRETPEARDVARAIAREKRLAGLRAADAARYPRCSSRRSQTEAYVQCRNGKVPRRRRLPGDDEGEARCACAPPDAADGPGFDAYDGCAGDAPKCFLPAAGAAPPATSRADLEAPPPPSGSGSGAPPPTLPP